VEVRLFATFRKGRFKKREMEFSEGSSLEALLESLKIAREEAGLLLLNGRYACGQDKLTAHDVVSIFPLQCGG
jgi:molybdopterin converting factor small subunit